MKKSLNYFFSKAKELKEKGEKVIALTLTSPEFSPPPLRERILKFYKKSFSYLPSGGDFKLRETLAKFYSKKWNVPLKKENTFVGSGGKEILFILLQLLLRKGGEAIIISPYWPSYPQMIKMAQGKVKILRTSEKKSFYLDVKKLEKEISPSTKVLIVNTPCNPTGRVLKNEDVKFLSELSLKKNFILISDEVYEIYDYEKKYVSFLKYFHKNIFCVFSASKTFSLCGWRVGWGFGKEDLISKMIDYQANLTTSPSSLSQLVIRDFFEKSQEIEKYFEKTRKEAQKRRELAIKFLRKKGIKFVFPEGGIAIFIKIPSNFKNAFSFAQTLLEKEKVSVAPGEIFGQRFYIRLNLAVSTDALEEGFKRILKYY